MIPKGQPLVLGSWLALILLATLRQVTSGQGGLPSPAAYVGSGVLFSMFFVGAAFAPELFGWLAVGVVVTALFKPYLHLNPKTGQSEPILNSGPIFQLSALLDQMSGTSKPTTGG